ncbi:galactose-specific lectin nattectin-like [Syngnathoides biaculeatus]|uniref:galactose-specific lectin nattectin-like n=1 Tax=Syngnathoides biaculeatus TaxID=300417 RepID=UPI002ADDA18C|nr:galactose-specific lectin nattectin-like [Syngnathoides biaculeatus]
MAFPLRLLFLLFGISGLLTEVLSFKVIRQKQNNCPHGWTRLDCKCYIYESEARTFVDAESICNILGGNLVSVHSNLENAFVRQLVVADSHDPDAAWIGLHDAIQNGDYIWTDGSDATFLSFNENDAEPNSNTGNCVEIDEGDGLWQTADCTDKNVYVCARDVYEPGQRVVSS